jgi:hypothetical protein
VLPDDAAVGYEFAAWLHGADVLDGCASVLTVVGQRGDQIRKAGIRGRSGLLDPTDVVRVHGVPVTSSARTAFDLARSRPLVEGVVAVDALLNRGGCDLDELRSYTADRPGWRGVRRARSVLTQAEPLSQSPMESRQRMRLVLAGLPRPRAQVPVEADGRVFAFIDNGYEEWHVGTDYDGHVHAERWRYDLERQERIREAGWWHRRYTSLHIRSGWQQMVRQVGEALLASGWRPGRNDHAWINAKQSG